MQPKLFYEPEERPLSSKGTIVLLIIAALVLVFVGFAVSYGEIANSSVSNFCKDNGYYQFLYSDGKPYCANSRETATITGKEIYCEQQGTPEYSCRFVSGSDLND